MGWLDDLLIGPLRAVLNAGVEMTSRRGVNFKSGFTLTDNAGDDSIDIEVDTPTASGTVPNDVGASGSIGVATTFARADHVHAHGTQPLGAGTGHAAATGAVAGFMSASDKTRFDALTPSNSTPANTGTASAGAAATYSRSDHVHGHGNEAGGALHTTATTDDEGFMPRAHYTLVQNATANPTASTIVKRDASAYIEANGYTIDQASSTAVIGYEDKASGSACETLYLAGQDASSGCDNGTPGGSLRLAVGAPKTARIGTDSYGVCVFDLGRCASGHGYQSGAITYNDNEGIGIDSGFYGDSSGSLYYRWAGNTTANGRTRNIGLRWQTSAEMAFSLGGLAASYWQVDGLQNSTIGARFYGSSTILQLTDSAITVARPATFSSAVVFDGGINDDLAFSSSLSSLDIGLAQDPSGAGAASTIHGQDAASGAYAGGRLTLRGGAKGQASAANGDVRLEMGTPTTSDYAGFVEMTHSGGTQVWRFGYNAGVSRASIYNPLSSYWILGNTLDFVSGGLTKALTLNASAQVGFFGATPVSQASRAGQLTDSTGGTATSTLGAGITDPVAKDAIASLAAKLNAIELMIHNIGISA